MTTKQRKPAVPNSFGSSAKALWRSVVKEWVLDEHELAPLREACRTVNLLDELDAVVRRDGPVVEGQRGKRAHPALVKPTVEDRACQAAGGASAA